MPRTIILIFLFIIVSQWFVSAQTTTSVLTNGNWYKLKIAQSGVYKLTYQQLKTMGFSAPEKVRVYGNGGIMLPVMNSEARFDDIIENKISKKTDHILFYVKAPVTWKYNTSKQIFEHSLHLFADSTVVFLTDFESNSNNLMETVDNASKPIANTITQYNERQFLEVDSINLIRSGRRWFWKHFKQVVDYNFTFTIPNLIDGTTRITGVFAAQSAVNSSFTISTGAKTQTVIVEKVRTGDATLLYANTAETTFTLSGNNSLIPINIQYNKSTSLSEGWLDYLIVNAQCELKIDGNQLHFRSVNSVANNSFSEFKINTNGSEIVVWDITNPLQPQQMQTNKNGNYVSFVGNTSTLREYVAFKTDGALQPTVNESTYTKIVNQNLHGYGTVDMIIVAHPLFLEQAEQLAVLHEKFDGMSSLIVTPEQIYNEFSAGMPDVSAIRDFVKLIYQRATPTDTLKYLLLFGDGSYNNKTISKTNTNFVLTYQSEESLDPIFSFASDDFFGLLDPHEGRHIGDLDIGIGRLPVKSEEEADLMLRKIEQYIRPSNKGEWGNTICFIADDADDNQRLHMVDANNIADRVIANYPYLNIEKIYLDAFPQIVTSAAQRYPDVSTAINNRIKKGALIINYTGHGNERKLTAEEVITTDIIRKWDNFERLPVFVTATCEFSRYDDYDQENKRTLTSAGELILLNPQGGGIALFTTSRVVFASSNDALNTSFYKFAFERDYANQRYRLGDMVRHAKNITSTESNINKRNFSLLGDPALYLAYPELTSPDYSVITSKINGKNTGEIIDTLKALSLIEVEGYLKNELTGEKMTDFDGELYVSVFDKMKENTTMNNDGAGALVFETQNSVIYKGITKIEKGDFKYVFRIPKDISYNFGTGKISYYAKRNTDQVLEDWEIKNVDLSGNFTHFVIGGTNSEIEIDQKGPDIELFINDTLYVEGGNTHELPILFAQLFDENGINTTGSGIGHDITLMLDNEYSNTLVLNDFYSANANSFQSGTITFQMPELSEGWHTATLKVWDVFNNSSEKSIQFKVVKSNKIVISHSYTYPNPFSDKTYFSFEHNQADNEIDVLIYIYSTTGQCMNTLRTKIEPTGFKTQIMEWDGYSAWGARLHNGVYVYRIEATNEEGEKTFDSGRLVILR